MTYLMKQLILGKEIITLISDINQNQISIPNFKENKNLIEEMSMLETHMQIQIENIIYTKRSEAENLIKQKSFHKIK